MGSDACFRMGSTHAICQDYAIAGAHQGAPYAIISDGCSGLPIRNEPGSPFTDYGARFLARAAKLTLPIFDEIAIIRHASQMATAANLPKACLDATLIVAIQQGEQVAVSQCGDGVVATRDRVTKQITYQTARFENNMPFYLSYLQHGPSLERYLKETRSMIVTSGTRIEEGRWSENAVETTLSPVRTHRFGIEFDLVLIMSDGAESFQTVDNVAVPLTDVLEQLFAIKGFEGEFVTRRCNRFLHKFCAEKGWKHTDDLSVAGIYMGAESTRVDLGHPGAVEPGVAELDPGRSDPGRS